jgi:hypothetical protein
MASMKKPPVAAILAMGEPHEDGEDEEKDDAAEEQDLDAIKKDAAEELLEAFRANDTTRLLDAFDTLLDSCLEARDIPDREEDEEEEEEDGGEEGEEP